MKHLSISAAALTFAALAFTACDKDGDTIYVDKVTDATVSSTSTYIVLDANNLDMLALTIYWNENGDITLSDPLVEAPQNAVTNTVQMALSEDFASCYEETMAAGVFQRQYTCAELNSAAVRAGMASGSTSPLHIRVKSVLGPNIAPTYSNILTINLTTYEVDMTIGKILDSGRVDTGRTLALTDKENVFAGFFNASSWENWYFQDPSSEVWGTASDPGKAFIITKESSDPSLWNLWFPEPAGCYFVTMDLRAYEWTALLIHSVNISGDLQDEMAFDRKSNCWTYTFNAEAKTYNLTLSTTSSLYDQTSGDGAPAQTDINGGFGGSAEAMTFGMASSVSVAVATAGETTLVLNLSNPKEWTLSAGAGAPEPPAEVRPFVYLPGITEPWDFNTFLKLYNADNLSYGGVNYVKSEWGYQIAVEEDNWSDVYTMADGDAFAGTLELAGKNNIAAPEEGIYLFDVSLGQLSYKLTHVEKVSYSGLNDDWNLHEMTATDNPCVFTAVVEKSANTPWGVKIIINDDWNLFFGGNETPGELVMSHDGFEGDNELENGTYTLTVDLAKGTYSYTK